MEKICMECGRIFAPEDDEEICYFCQEELCQETQRWNRRRMEEEEEAV
jgi:RNA polymerase subunit RPABC4/transcription elongation factor Spt4